MFSSDSERGTWEHPLLMECSIVRDVTARAAAQFTEHDDDDGCLEGLGGRLMLSNVILAIEEYLGPRTCFLWFQQPPSCTLYQL